MQCCCNAELPMNHAHKMATDHYALDLQKIVTGRKDPKHRFQAESNEQKQYEMQQKFRNRTSQQN